MTGSSRPERHCRASAPLAIRYKGKRIACPTSSTQCPNRFASNNGAHRSAFEFPIVKWRVQRARSELCFIHRPFEVGINQRYIARRADTERSAIELQQTRRLGGEHRNEPR